MTAECDKYILNVWIFIDITLCIMYYLCMRKISIPPFLSFLSTALCHTASALRPSKRD